MSDFRYQLTLAEDAINTVLSVGAGMSDSPEIDASKLEDAKELIRQAIPVGGRTCDRCSQPVADDAVLDYSERIILDAVRAALAY